MTRVEDLPVIYVPDDRLRTTSLCLCVAYGARDDPANGGGLAHLLEHLLMAAPGPDGISFSEYVERLGGQANAETGLEFMLFYAQVHADDADDITVRLVHAVTDPLLTSAALDTERDVVLQELAAAEADPSDTVQDAFLAAIFPQHPLGRPVGGTASEVRGLTLADVAAGHREVFLPSPMVLVIVGPRLPAGFADRATVPAVGGTPERRPVAPCAVDDGAPVWPDEYAWLCIGGRSAPRGTAGREAFTVLAQLLGSSPSSLLYRRLRVERGLAYAFEAWDREYTEAGAWRVLIGVDKGNGPEVTSVVTGVLETLAAAGPASDDLAAARRQAQMRVILDTETSLEHARLLARRTGGGTNPFSLDDELATLGRVTAADVRDSAAAVLATLTTVVRPRGER